MTTSSDIYREQLVTTYPELRHAIWERSFVGVGAVGKRNDRYLRSISAS